MLVLMDYYYLQPAEFESEQFIVLTASLSLYLESQSLYHTSSLRASLTPDSHDDFILCYSPTFSLHSSQFNFF